MRLKRLSIGIETKKHQTMLANPEAVLLEDFGSTVLRCSTARIDRSPTSISVRASSGCGFDMAINVIGGRFVLAFGDWIEEFDDAEVARGLFNAALDGKARLKVDLLSGRKWRWTLERRDALGRWVPESTIGHVIWRFWGQQDVVYLRNDFGPH